MDPTTNLAAQRRLAARILAASDRDDGTDTSDDAVMLAGLVEALDAWLSHGGFSPWQKPGRSDGSDGSATG